MREVKRASKTLYHLIDHIVLFGVIHSWGTINVLLKSLRLFIPYPRLFVYACGYIIGLTTIITKKPYNYSCSIALLKLRLTNNYPYQNKHI